MLVESVCVCVCVCVCGGGGGGGGVWVVRWCWINFECRASY